VTNCFPDLPKLIALTSTWPVLVLSLQRNQSTPKSKEKQAMSFRSNLAMRVGLSFSLLVIIALALGGVSSSLAPAKGSPANILNKMSLN
jgi:hypothetical protein